MTMQTEEDLRVRSYLVTQANKLSVPELVEKVRRDTLPLREVAEAVPAERLFERPAAEDWSAAEVLTHILQINDSGARAIAGILDHGTLPPPITDRISGETWPGLDTPGVFWQTYESRREGLLDRAMQATGDEYPDVKITHSQFGELSWREWLLFMRVHDLDHLRQLQAITRQFAG